MENCEVPIEILVRVLGGLQQIIYLLATVAEKGTVKQRFKVPLEMQQRYALRASIPQPGSYTLPIVLNSGFNSHLGNYTEIMEKLEDFFSSLIHSNFKQTQDIFPDSKLRNRALLESKRILPKAGENWSLGFSLPDRPELNLTNGSTAYINGWLNQESSEDTVMTVTGELIRIDFDKRTIVLKYPPTHQEIECFYLEELEDSMIENRRQLIQVTGQFTLDAEGHPTKLTDVTRIEPVELSPIILREISWLERKLICKNPLRLIPKMDEDTSQLFVVEEPNIGLHVFAYTRDDLIYEINEQIVMMWDEYAKASVEDLASDAQHLRKQLLNQIEEV
ncbi:hypothetical protein [Microcoleus sp. OTE_8_concoct_300]|uniref:hypothetical protein n=1 Tax=Microcoleus sp. OTE_8_concoct_300 TaxID=2964710 RepID=UPI00403F3AB1